MIPILTLATLTIIAAGAALWWRHRRIRGTLLGAIAAVEESGQALDRAMAAAADYKAKWESQVGVLEGVIKEREDIWRLYQSACLGAGNAQRLLIERLGSQGATLEASKRLLELASRRLSELDPDLGARCREMAVARLPELSEEMKAFLAEYGAAADALPEKAPSPVPAPLASGAPPRIVSRETSGPQGGGGMGANP